MGCYVVIKIGFVKDYLVIQKNVRNKLLREEEQILNCQVMRCQGFLVVNVEVEAYDFFKFKWYLF